MQIGVGGLAGDEYQSLRRYLPDPSLGPHDPTTAVELAALVLIKDKGAPTGQPIDAYAVYVRAYNGSGPAADAYAARVLADAHAYQGAGTVAFGRACGAALGTPIVPGNKARILPSGDAAAPADAPAVVQAMIAAGNRIDRFPYSYGGAHGDPAQTMSQSNPDPAAVPGAEENGGPGYDCSSATSYVLWGGGFGRSVLGGGVLVSGDLENVGDPGPGKWVTIYATAGHAYIDVAGIYFDTAAGMGNPPNPPSTGPRWSTVMRGPGGTVRVRSFANEFAEANWVTGQIADALAGGIPPAEILALARTGYATEPLQRALAHSGIPHRVLGSLGLYERTEVRDALAYLALIQNPVDAQAFRRAIGAPRRGIGPATVTKVVAWARERHGGDLIAASARAGELDGIRAEAARIRLAEFGSALEQVRGELDAGRSIGHAVIATVTIPGGLVRHYQHQRDHTPDPDRRRDAERVLEDLRSLCRAANAYDEHDEHATLTGFLEQAAGLHAQELDAATDRRITVSTIHRAKGVEAQAVALLGCEEELLPSWRSISSPNRERLAEERRLFYVAATRAKDRLLITHVAERGRRPTGGPSRFLTEAGLQQTPTSLAA